MHQTMSRLTTTSKRGRGGIIGYLLSRFYKFIIFILLASLCNRCIPQHPEAGDYKATE